MGLELRMDAGAAAAGEWIAAEAAARQLQEQQRLFEAVSLAMSQGMDDLAAQLLAESTDLIIASGDFDPFFSAIDALGPERFRRWPQLEAATVWALTMSNRLRLARLRLDDLEARIPELKSEGRTFIVDHRRTPFDRLDPDTGMWCWTGMVRVMIDSFSGESTAALERARQWCAQFPRAPDYCVAVVQCGTALAHCMLGDFARSEQDALSAYGIFREARIEFGIAWAASCAACQQLTSGRVAEAWALLQEARSDVVKSLGRPTYAVLPLDISVTLAHFERGDIVRALAEAEGRLAQRSASPVAPMLYSDVCIAARAYLALGRPDDALALFRQKHIEPPHGDQSWWQRAILGEHLRTALLAGAKPPSPARLPDAPGDVWDLMAACFRPLAPALLRPLRALVRRLETQQLSEALIIALVLKARVEHKTGQALQARRSITQLLRSPQTRTRLGSLASAAQAVRPVFLDALQALLNDPGTATPELHKLAEILGQTSANGPSPADAPPSLSAREQQIAKALLEGLSNREISHRLHLSEQTVKWHLWNLFQKLGVRNRLGAARTLSAHGLA